MSVWWVAVALILCSPQVHSRNFTHDDIRDAIVTLVHMVRASEDKLERHEYREKALGDQLKRMLSGLDKKHRALEPLKGMISRLDERLSNVETILLQKEEREKATQKKTNEALDGIQKSLQSLSLTITENIKQSKNTMEIDNNLTLNEESPLERRLATTDAKIDDLKIEIKNINKGLKDALEPSILLEKPLKKQFVELETLLKSYNSTLHKMCVMPQMEVALANEARHNNITEVMKRQEEDIKKVQKILSDAKNIWKELPNKNELQITKNETLNAVAKISGSSKDSSEDSVAKLEVKLREMNERVLSTNEDIQKSLTDVNTLTERAYNDISRNYEALRTEIQTLKKGEDVMLQTADNVITNRKIIDYGIKRISMDVSELLKIQARSMNRTINDRFAMVEATLMSSQSIALANLTLRLEEELSSVWRQIGIMHQQLMSTTASLELLTNETQQYINSSTKTMGKVKEEVGDISTRVLELGSNLNYALGRLALATQEFSQMSTGLADVLSGSKGDGKKVETKTEDVGPGPHNITSAVAEKKP